MAYKYKLIYSDGSEKIVNDKILPFFQEGSLSLQIYNEKEKTIELKDEILILYLPENHLKNILSELLGTDKIIAFLPHERSGSLLQDFGVSSILADAINDILNNDKAVPVNVLFCNEIPVFHSVNIGEGFMSNLISQERNFIKKIREFVNEIRILSKTFHKPYTIAVNDTKIIETSAASISIVANFNNLLISNRVLLNGSRDGFHSIIASPRSVMEVIRFLLARVISNKKRKTLPEFIGYIKNNNIKISSKKAIDFTLDGKQLSALDISCYLREKQLNIIAGRNFNPEFNKLTDKAIQKIQALPVGEAKEEFVLKSIPFVRRASTEEFKELFNILRENAVISQEFLVMLILATLIATFGLFASSAPVIIGAMILAPLMAPIISIAMGIVRQDVELTKTSATTLAIGTCGALFFGFMLTFLIPMKRITPEIQARLSPNLLDLMVAFVSGVAAAYANSKEKIAKSLAGVAIAVALVPPLAVSGIGIGWGRLSIFTGAFLLYLTNLAGIILSAGLTFIILGFAPFRRAKKGLFYILLTIIIICIPLTYSFYEVAQITKMTKMVEELETGSINISDIDIIKSDDIYIRLKLTSENIITDNDMNNIKTVIEKKLKKQVSLEITTAIKKSKS